jgi:septal ring factor EnvC (AmiA/AmiB activator)
MWGRGKRNEELSQRISALTEEVEDQRSEYIHLTNLNTKLNDRVSVLQRHVGDAQRARDEAEERAHDLARQIDHLARWFQDNAPDKIREGSAINNAIVLLNEGKRLEEDMTTYADALDKRTHELNDAEHRIGMQDAEIKQLRIDLAAAHKTLTEGGAVTVITDPELTKEIENAIDHPETLVKRDRPKRKL